MPPFFAMSPAVIHRMCIASAVTELPSTSNGPGIAMISLDLPAARTRRSAWRTLAATALTTCRGERFKAALRDRRSALPSIAIMSAPCRGKVEKRPLKALRFENPGHRRLAGVVARDAVLDLPEATAGPFFVRPDCIPLVQIRPVQGTQ